MRKYSRVTCTNGDTFKLAFNENHFNKSDIITMNPSGFKCKVIKVRKFNLWRKFLFWLGYDFVSLELEEVKDAN